MTLLIENTLNIKFNGMIYILYIVFLKKTLWVVLVAVFVPSISTASEFSLTIKEKLTNRVHSQLKEIQKNREDFDPSQAIKRFENTAMFNPRHRRPSFEELKVKHYHYYNDKENKLSSLKIFIDKTSNEELPNALVLRFLTDNKVIDAPYLESYIWSIDEDVILPIIAKHYNEFSSVVRKKILIIFKSRKALPIVKIALDDSDFKVKTQAEKSLTLIFRILKYNPELKKMLIATKNSWRLKPTARNFNLIGNKDWYESFFKLAKAGKASFDELDFLGDIEDCPEEVIVNNMIFLIKILISNHGKTSFFHQGPLLINNPSYHERSRQSLEVVKAFLLNFNQRKYLRHLYPILPIVLYDRYSGSRTVVDNTFQWPSGSINTLRFNDRESDQFLEKIALILQSNDVEAWQRNITMSSDFRSDLFLQSLIAQKKGVDFTPHLENFSLKITVINREDSEVLATSKYFLKYGQKNNIVLASKNKHFSSHNITFSVRLDTDKWMFLASVLIDFKPHGAGFKINIPIDGAKEMFFSTPDFPVVEKKLSTKWIFEHVYEQQN